MGGQLISTRGERVRVPLPARVAWRYFVTGKELWGAGDNATFLHDATSDYRGRPYEKLTRARWRRVARRWAAVVSMGLLTVALMGNVWARVLLMLMLMSTCSWAVVLMSRLVRTEPTYRRYVDPAAQVLCGLVGVKYRRRHARRLIALPTGFGGEHEQEAVRITVPVNKDLPTAMRKRIVAAVGGRLGIPDAHGEWLETAAFMTVDIKGTPRPPTEVSIEQLMPHILRAPAHQPVLGMGGKGAVVSVDYEQDSPHMAASGGPGTGKTTVMRLLLSQRVRHGHGLIIFDGKGWSHKWARKLPTDRCRYLFTVQDMHDGAVALGEELERRIHAPEEMIGKHRPVNVVCEEMNSLRALLANYWKTRRQEIMAAAKDAKANDMPYEDADLNPPTTSPAIQAIQYAVFMGREMGIYVHVMAQRFSAATMGPNGGDVRESFQLRLMAKWDKKLWQMLADGIAYVAWPGGKRGIWGLVQDGVFKIVRVPNITDEQALELALGGGPVYGPVLGEQSASPVIDGSSTPSIEEKRVKLSEALPQLPAGRDGDMLSLEGLRSAAKRPGFPARGADGLFDLQELILWRAEKVGAEVSGLGQIAP
jgi:hypothetical protein